MPADLIQSDPAIMMGKPVIRGTGVTVEFILEKLAAGESVEPDNRGPSAPDP